MFVKCIYRLSDCCWVDLCSLQYTYESNVDFRCRIECGHTGAYTIRRVPMLRHTIENKMTTSQKQEDELLCGPFQTLANDTLCVIIPWWAWRCSDYELVISNYRTMRCKMRESEIWNQAATLLLYGMHCNHSDNMVLHFDTLHDSIQGQAFQQNWFWKDDWHHFLSEVVNMLLQP